MKKTIELETKTNRNLRLIRKTVVKTHNCNLKIVNIVAAVGVVNTCSQTRGIFVSDIGTTGYKDGKFNLTTRNLWSWVVRSRKLTSVKMASRIPRILLDNHSDLPPIGPLEQTGRVRWWVAHALVAQVLVRTVEPVQRRWRLAKPVSVQRPGGRRHDPSGEDRSRVTTRLTHGGHQTGSGSTIVAWCLRLECCALLASTKIQWCSERAAADRWSEPPGPSSAWYPRLTRLHPLRRTQWSPEWERRWRRQRPHQPHRLACLALTLLCAFVLNRGIVTFTNRSLSLCLQPAVPDWLLAHLKLSQKRLYFVTWMWPYATALADCSRREIVTHPMFYDASTR